MAGAKQSSNSARRRERRLPAGVAVRKIAVEVVSTVLAGDGNLDTALDRETGKPAFAGMESRDKALLRAIVSTLFRRRGQLEEAIGRFLTKSLPPKASRAQAILMIGAVQILFLDIPDHAAVSSAVDLAGADRRARPWKGLVNGVLRRIAENRDEILATQNPERLNTPRWLWKRWRKTYGETVRKAIAGMHLEEPCLDLSAKTDVASVADMVGGVRLPTGSIRLENAGLVTAIPGYQTGDWWVQDAAAGLPVKLLGDVKGLSVADLCAAPGGKTAQLAATGARVVAVDRSEPRLKRLSENLARLSLEAEIVKADLLTWTPDREFDAILLDAPCSSTGTIRRHPDTGWLRSDADVARMAELQARFLTVAAELLRPGGLLVYCTCSLEPEEGEEQITAFLSRHPDFERVPISASEVGDLEEIIDPQGDLRTLPCHLSRNPKRIGGLDGFFASRLRRRP